ncbi:hypothetical protein LDENG_00006580, partial [Lucifuga dentata]
SVGVTTTSTWLPSQTLLHVPPPPPVQQHSHPWEILPNASPAYCRTSSGLPWLRNAILHRCHLCST